MEMDREKKGYWGKKVLNFLLFIWLHSQTEIFSLTHLKCLLEHIFQSIPLISTRRRCDRYHIHIGSIDLPINFHRFKIVTKGKKNKTKFLFTQNHSFEFLINVNVERKKTHRITNNLREFPFFELFDTYNSTLLLLSIHILLVFNWLKRIGNEVKYVMTSFYQIWNATMEQNADVHSQFALLF